MRLPHLMLLLSFLLIGACDGGVEPGDGAAGPGNTAADDAEEGVSGSSDVTKVTLTSFVLEDGAYREMGTPLVFEVGVPCQTWSREAKGDDINPEDGHLHYNAATDVAFDGTTLTWTEFGPEHEDGVVVPLCESGDGGASKSANNEDYTPATDSSANRAYLKVTAVE
ncbi:MAG: hypothetical protein ACPGU1_20505 [Myxococcota bacterium]